CGQKRREERRGEVKGGKKPRGVLLRPSINSPSLYRRHPTQRGGRTPRTHYQRLSAIQILPGKFLVDLFLLDRLPGSWCSFCHSHQEISCLILTFRSQLPLTPLPRRMLGTLVQLPDQKTTFMYASSSVMVARA
uniref:Uncharacterized protein n=1 Tax=Triticum urartu TaxID=4572 RepID=A0A8R7TGV0_TRIUA